MLRLWYQTCEPCFTMFHHVSMFCSFRIFRQSRWHIVTCAGCTTLWRQGGWIGYHTDPTSLYDKHVWNLDVTGQSLIELETEKEFLQNKQTSMWSHPWVRCEFSGLFEHAFKVQWTCRNSWIFADRGGWWVGARPKFIFGAFKDAEKREGYWWVLMCIGMISTAVWDC